MLLFSSSFLIKISSITVAMLLTACFSYEKQNAAVLSFSEMKIFGAKYQGRYRSKSPFIEIDQVANKEAVINQADFLIQLDNLRNYSNALTKNFADSHNKIEQWVLAGADTKALAEFNIYPQLMSGIDGYQNVLMTGYYSPVIHARHKAQGKYIHPIYALPKGERRFTRAQIYAGALAGKNLELAYTDSMLDNFLLGVQGSGYVDFGNGELSYFAYAGQNGLQYSSIGRFLVENGEIPKQKMSIQAIQDWANRNPSRLQNLLERNLSYIFFKKDPSGQVKGSTGVPLVPMAAVASDKKLVPSGSVLLVEVPQIDQQGNWIGEHKLHLMIALDVGGAIKGQHFDLYRGIGDQAGHISGLFKHYGRVWILR